MITINIVIDINIWVSENDAPLFLHFRSFNVEIYIKKYNVKTFIRLALS